MAGATHRRCQRLATLPLLVNFFLLVVAVVIVAYTLACSTWHHFLLLNTPTRNHTGSTRIHTCIQQHTKASRFRLLRKAPLIYSMVMATVSQKLSMPSSSSHRPSQITHTGRRLDTRYWTKKRKGHCHNDLPTCTVIMFLTAVGIVRVVMACPEAGAWAWRRC